MVKAKNGNVGNLTTLDFNGVTRKVTKTCPTLPRKVKTRIFLLYRFQLSSRSIPGESNEFGLQIRHREFDSHRRLYSDNYASSLTT